MYVGENLIHSDMNLEHSGETYWKHWIEANKVLPDLGIAIRKNIFLFWSFVKSFFV